MPAPRQADAVLDRATYLAEGARRAGCAVAAPAPVDRVRGDRPAAATDRLWQDVVPATDVRAFVDGNRHLIFGEADAGIGIVGATVGPASYFQEERFGRWLDIRYRDAGGRQCSLKLWLKFGPGLDALFPLLADYHRRLADRVFPRPYFATPSPDHGSAVLATAFASGPTLLNRVRAAAVSRRIAPIEAIFGSNGQKMRAFHDASAPLGSLDPGALAGRIATAIGTSRYLAAAERDALLAHIGAARQLLSSAVIPLVRTHNDWVLRNIIVAPDGSDCVIDTDDLLASPNTRWHDIGLFLLDVETQLKWSPLITRRLLARLWRAFWIGYSGNRAPPDALSPAQQIAMLYLVRAQWLAEGVVHKPHFDMLSDGRLRNLRIRRWLKQGLLRGQHSLLDLPSR